MKKIEAIIELFKLEEVKEAPDDMEKYQVEQRRFTQQTKKNNGVRDK
jgi:nitrogen regulatory protein PII